MSSNDSLDTRTWVALGLITVVLIVAIVLVAIKAASSSGTATANSSDTAAPSSLVTQLASVADLTFATVAQGANANAPVAITAPALTDSGKPELLYMGAEYCPYCAAERWPMIVALSRFGTFTNLALTTSSSTDTYPSTPTFSFHGSSFDSQYLSFVPVESETNQPNGNGGYTSLDTPTAAQQQIQTTYDNSPYLPAASAGAIPFIDFGGKYLISGASYNPQVLAGKTQAQVAATLTNTSDPITQSIVGSANVITATICKMTNNTPVNVCKVAPIPTIEQSLSTK